MKRIPGLVAATALASAAFLSEAEAAPIITVDPVTQNIGLGDEATVNIVVSDLSTGTIGGTVGAFNFDLTYNPSILTGVSFTNDPGNVMDVLTSDPGLGGASDDSSYGFGKDISGNPLAGNLDIYVSSAVAADLGTVAAAEGGSFILTTITFAGSSAGTSALNFSDSVLSNFDGSGTIAATATGGSICVGGCGIAAAPEIDPAGALSAFTLLTGGLAALRGRRIKK